MHRNTIGILMSAAIFCGFATIASAAEKKCYETRMVEGSISCNANNDNSADFGRGCASTTNGFQEVEVECPSGEWVNVSQDTRIKSNGNLLTQAQICKVYGMVSAKNNGKVCASGQRPAATGTGWESINYKYGKDKVTPRDGGDTVKKAALYFATGIGEDKSDFDKRDGTMCYDADMDEQNHTDKDALVAVFCK